MKKLLIMLVFGLFPLTTLAYTPTAADNQRLETIEEKIDGLYPQQASRLVRAYDTLGTKKVQMKLAGGDRGVYLLEAMQDILMEKLFTQLDVCFENHAQRGDTAEIIYKVYADDGTLVRESKDTFAFTIGAKNVWKTLSVSALGLQAGTIKIRNVPTLGVTAENQESEEKLFSASAVFANIETLFVGQEVVFGSPRVDGAIVGVFTGMQGDELVFDFADAVQGETVSVFVNIQSLIKGCN